MKKNTINMKTLMNEINSASKLLKKSFIFEDFEQDPRMQQQEMGTEGEMPQDGMEQGMPQHGGDMEEQDPQVSEQTVDCINQIRELAIQGIAEFANDVESEEYQALKKIWLLTDKFYEGMQDDGEQKKSF